MRQPMTIADHHASRMIAEPLRLFDCNIETDGACALIVTSTRAGARPAPAPRHHPRRRPGGGLASHPPVDLVRARPRRRQRGPGGAPALGEHRACAPRDVDAFFCYDFFTSFVIMALEDYGFCARGEGGPFVAGGAPALRTGRLPTNTNGGQLSEAFIHGFNNNLEAVRQIRGTSTSQVADCELVLLAGAQHRPDRRGHPAEVSGHGRSSRAGDDARPSVAAAHAGQHEFYEAARRGELRFQRCADCGAWRHYPRPSCPQCLSRRLWLGARERARPHLHLDDRARADPAGVPGRAARTTSSTSCWTRASTSRARCWTARPGTSTRTCAWKPPSSR